MKKPYESPDATLTLYFGRERIADTEPTISPTPSDIWEEKDEETEVV